MAMEAALSSSGIASWFGGGVAEIHLENASSWFEWIGGRQRS